MNACLFVELAAEAGDMVPIKYNHSMDEAFSIIMRILSTHIYIAGDCKKRDRGLEHNSFLKRSESEMLLIPDTGRPWYRRH